MTAALVAPPDGLTDEQRAAVERREGDLLLAAAAGSGKTRVLVERFVRTVQEDGVDPTRILAITFTEKAAGELRARVAARFAELGDTANARALEGGWISTIHGFCARLLRAHALAAGVPPGFAVLDEGQAARLAGAAFGRALDALAEQAGADGTDLVAAYGAPRLREAIVGVWGELRSRGEERPALPPPPAVPPAGPLREALAGAREAAFTELAAARDGVRVNQARDALTACAEHLAAPSQAAPLGGGPPPAQVAPLAALGPLALPRGNGALSGPACVAYREALAAYVQREVDARALEAYPLLGFLLIAFGDAYSAAKRARGALDFDDLEHAGHALLRDDADIRARYAERFAQVLVDEFQDTNPLQLALIEQIAHGRLFTVGDAGQSIYGFRHADVGLFRRRAEELAEHDSVLRLTTNFRSRPEILHVLNEALGPRLGRDFLRLVPGRTGAAPAPVEDDPARPRLFDPSPAPPPRVELLLTDSAAEWTGAPGASAPAWRLAEARAVAARLAGLRTEGCRAGDIVVLLRAATDLGLFERALEEAGLPTYVIGGRGYWERPEVQDLVAWLSILANPRDGQRLYEVLASPLVGLSSDALVLLAAAARETGRDPWWVLREPGESLAALPAADRARLDRFVALLAAERAGAPRRPLDTLVDRAVHATGYEHDLLSRPAGERRRANVRKLMRLAREYEVAEGRDLRAFLDAVGRLGDPSTPESREGEAPVEGEDLDAVRLMTIHRAKGLEFPVVCVADLGRRPLRGGRELLRVSADGRVGMKLATLEESALRPALAYADVGVARERAEAEEETRLFYVAMTRARERLLLSGAVDPERWPGDFPGCPPVAWIAPALIPDVGARMRRAEGSEHGVVERGEGAERATVRFTFVRPEATSPAIASQPDRDFPRQAREIPISSREPLLEWVAPEVGAAMTPAVARLSYSSLQAFDRCAYRFYLQHVLGLPEREEPPEPGAAGLSGRARGTIAHVLLERLDPRRPTRPDEAALAAAAREAGERATEAELAGVADLVDAAASSPVMARLASARHVRHEQRFAFALPGGPLVTGALDVVAEEPDGMLVVDWKTDRLGGREPEELVAADYVVQRLVYALAILRGGAQTVEVAHLFLESPDQPATAHFTQADRPALEAELDKRVANVTAGDFPVAPTPNANLCSGCPGRGTLCSWSLEATLAAAPLLY